MAGQSSQLTRKEAIAMAKGAECNGGKKSSGSGSGSDKDMTKK